MSEPRAYTEEEARQLFLEQVYEIMEFWVKESRKSDLKDKMEGCIFSILALIDGSNIGIPAMTLAMNPHPEDKSYHQGQGENWFEDGLEITGNVELHNEWCRLRAKKDGVI
jgi:hypothetical protein